jgi:predicted TPR repeat methyltransferase
VPTRKGKAVEPTGQQDLENTSKLGTPDDNFAYCRGFDEIYDTDFGEQLGYCHPSAIAAAYLVHADAGADVPIVDVGCGTGIVAAELKLPCEIIDGMDIFSEMPSVARSKTLCRNLFEVDSTGTLQNISNAYGVVLSAGTFTLGCLGPEPLRNLLQIAQSGALFVIGVNRAHFEKHGFSRILDQMARAKEFGPLEIAEINIYAKQGHEHSADRVLILHYRKAQLGNCIF